MLVCRLSKIHSVIPTDIGELRGALAEHVAEIAEFGGSKFQLGSAEGTACGQNCVVISGFDRRGEEAAEEEATGTALECRYAIDGSCCFMSTSLVLCYDGSAPPTGKTIHGGIVLACEHSSSGLEPRHGLLRAGSETGLVAC